MDLDISDILADISKPDSSTLSSHQPSYNLTSSSHTDHQLLIRAWTAERCSPSLLPYQGALIDRNMSRIQTQITRIEDLTSGVDSSNAYGGATTTGGGGSGNNTNLILSILQTDLSRTQFVVRSYVRQRLAKVTRHAGFYLKFHGTATENPTTPPLLSPSEISFLQHHQALLSGFYDASFLSSFPPNLRRLDDSAGGINMVEPPDGGVGVVVRCLREEWDNEDEVYRDDEEDEGRANVELRFRRGEVWVVRWRDVRSGVVKGYLECL